MTTNQIIDLIIVLIGVSWTVIVAIYVKNKVAIDKKAQQGNLLAKSEQVVAQSVMPLVYQAQKDGGEGVAKFNQVLDGLLAILDLAHLPHPTKEYLSGEIEKGVTTMKHTQEIINSISKSKKDDGTK